MSYSFFCPTRTMIDSYTQTDENLNFDVDQDLFQKKAKAVIAFHLYNNNDELDCKNICISSLTKLSTSELSMKHGGINARFLFVKTIELLIEETVNTKEEIFKHLLNEVRESELLTYALNLVYCNGAQRILDTRNTIDTAIDECRTETPVHSIVQHSDFLAAYCYALSCFVNNDNQPVDAINAARDVSSDMITSTITDLIYELTCCMVASSYGVSFIVYDALAIDEAYKTLFVTR